MQWPHSKSQAAPFTYFNHVIDKNRRKVAAIMYVTPIVCKEQGDCVTIGNLLNINNTTSYTFVSFGISLHFILSPYICDTNNVQRKGNCVTIGGLVKH